ncbi:hypothetical protein [Croceicoccus sp. Ery15]|uniref:hypothetical protein n=1 Tax=Croceicoccus sp. Ery15 TaxID=1703338 RepID=UPI001E416C67|nr:hypothetical protein [Croceicoccus sp. Ery15]
MFEPSRFGPLLVAEDGMRDFAVGDEVEIALSNATPVLFECGSRKGSVEDRDAALARGEWAGMEAVIFNPNDQPVTFELALGPASMMRLRSGSKKIETHRGNQVMRIDVPARSSRSLRWDMRDPSGSEPA